MQKYYSVNIIVPCQARLSKRAACRQEPAWQTGTLTVTQSTCRQKPAERAENLTVGTRCLSHEGWHTSRSIDCQVFILSAETHQTSKNSTSAARFLSPGSWTLKPKTFLWDVLPVAKKLPTRSEVLLTPSAERCK